MFRMLHRVTGGEQTRHHGYARLLLGRPHLGVPSVCLQIVPRPGRVLSQEGVRRAPQGSCEARGRVALGQAIVPCFRAASRPYAVLPACRAVRWDECGAHVCSAPPACSEAMMLDRVGAAWVWPCVQLFWALGVLAPCVSAVYRDGTSTTTTSSALPCIRRESAPPRYVSVV